MVVIVRLATAHPVGLGTGLGTGLGWVERHAKRLGARSPALPAGAWFLLCSSKHPNPSQILGMQICHYLVEARHEILWTYAYDSSGYFSPYPPYLHVGTWYSMYMKLHTRARGIPSHPSSPFIIMVRHAYFIMSYKFKCKVEYLHEGTDISTVPLTTCMPHPLILKDRSKLLRTWGKADVPSQWLLASIFQWSAHLQFCMHT